MKKEEEIRKIAFPLDKNYYQINYTNLKNTSNNCRTLDNFL